MCDASHNAAFQCDLLALLPELTKADKQPEVANAGGRQSGFTGMIYSHI